MSITGKFVDMLIRAARHGDAHAQYALGMMCLGKGTAQDYLEAAKWLGKAASQGDVDAQYHLGRMYYFGRGVQRSHRKATMWLLRAAEQGHDDADFLLRLIHAEYTTFPHGKGILRYKGTAHQHPKPKKWQRRNIKGNCPKAQYNLGVMHLTGDGVPIDPAEAYTYFLLAAVGGERHAEEAMQLAAIDLTRAEIAAAQAYAR